MNTKIRKKAFSLIELSIVILIVGIIIAGVASSSSLVKKFRLNSAKVLTQSSPVSSIKDLALWLETTDENSFTKANGSVKFENNDPIASWNDRNPQKTRPINFTQSDNSLRPKYLENGINGLPSLLFDYQNRLESTLSAITAGGNKYTIFVVWQDINNPLDGTSPSDAQVIFFQGGEIPCLGGDYAGFYTNLNNVYTWGCSFGNDELVLSYKPDVPYMTAYRVDTVTTNNVTTNNVAIYANNSVYRQSSLSSLDIGGQRMGIGYSGNGDDSFYYTGLISEIIVYDRALANEEVDAVRKYLIKKYAIKG